MAIYESLFANEPIVQRAHVQLRALPTFKDSGWRPLQPHQWPDPSRCSFIGHDTENKEFDFDAGGPGWGRGAVSTVGDSYSLHWGDGSAKCFYVPKRHEVDAHLNIDPEVANRYKRDVLQGTPNIPKGYANALYDIGTSTEDKVYVTGQVFDVQYAEALLTENDPVALGSLGKKYLGEGKDTNELYDWCAKAYGGEPTSGQRKNIYRTSPILAGPYAEQDAALLLPILSKQWPILERQGQLELFRMECRMIRLLVRMRLQGVRIDVPYVESLLVKIKGEQAIKAAEWHVLTGFQLSPTLTCASGEIAMAFDKLGISYRRTEKTQKPSITADDLKLIHHRVAALALELRQLSMLKNTFLEGGLLNRHVNGIVHGSFENLRGDGSGTRSGRFASNNPNLQNIPVRTELGKLIRKAYVPFAGHLCWEESDYSQYEYRWLAHYAVGAGSDQLRADYNNDPKTDFHVRTHDQIKSIAQTAYQQWLSQGLDEAKIRKRVKTVNFGNMNLMGKDLLAATLSISVKEAEPLLSAYHDANPYIKATVAWAQGQAEALGFISTLTGRRSYFDSWEPAKKQWMEEEHKFKFYPAMSYEKAIATYGSNIQRARCQIALNRLTQGGNADGIKVAMDQMDREGVFDIIGVPTLTVHDSLGHSVIDDSPARKEAHARKVEIMETALPLRVPTKVDTTRGPNWGEC
jgi:DNA polymerase I-like protein with 3'-5' exonuclease and polymerase domains